MWHLRVLLGVGGLVLLAGVIGCAEPAQAAGTWVEVSPSKVTAGKHVILRASCAAGADTATVTSTAFGTVALRSLNTFLQAEALVRPSTPDGTYDADLSCGDGTSATTTLWVRAPRPVAVATPTVGPHTGGGFLATGGHGRPEWASRLAGPTGWLLGGLAFLIGAAMLATTSIRRVTGPAAGRWPARWRRRGPARRAGAR